MLNPLNRQSSLGTPRVHHTPEYNIVKIARVTSTKELNTFGRIEAVFLDYGQPSPIWVFNDIDREPEAGDHILVGFIDGRKDMPYMKGFMKNRSYTNNFIRVLKDMVRLQLPIFGIGQKGGKAHKDVQEFLDDKNINDRAYVDMTPNHIKAHFPWDTGEGNIEITKTETILSFKDTFGTAHIKITASGIELSHPTGNVTINVPNGHVNVT